MIVLEQQTWVTLLAFAGVSLALFSYLAMFRRDMKTDMNQTRTELKGDILELRTELKDDISGLRTELKGDILELRTELKGDILELRTELKGDISDLRAEMKDGFRGIDLRLTSLEQRTYDISTRLPPAASHAS